MKEIYTLTFLTRRLDPHLLLPPGEPSAATCAAFVMEPRAAHPKKDLHSPLPWKEEQSGAEREE